MPRSLPISLLVPLAIATQSARAAEPPRVRELRTQQVGANTYFHVEFERPPQLDAPRLLPRFGAFDFWLINELGRTPALVPQDGQARAVYPRVEINGVGQAQGPAPTGLEFVGKVATAGTARFLVGYSVEKAPDPKQGERQAQPPQYEWVEAPVEVDFAKAQRLPPVKREAKRTPDGPLRRDDLEGLWAAGQALRFAALENQTAAAGYFAYAKAATARKYRLPAAVSSGLAQDAPRSASRYERLYETTTGATAIAESLQVERMLNANAPNTGKREVDVTKVAGIDIAEHPWQKMMGDHKPEPEPLARLVPHDHYYVHFKNIRKLIELGELSEQWGTSLVRAYEVQSRDFQLKQRYERQLCLRSTALGRTLGPLVVRGVAITGSDAYLREGSDVTVLFQVVNADLFRAAVEPFVQEARKEWGDQFKEGKADYHGVAVEQFATPLREVSLHRATLGDVVAYSNSPAALRRVIDTRQGRRPSLADGLDFQYMRTVFRASDPEEDGFVFLSDPFIRQLVGPASKIKEKRRLEAITNLAMVTHDALFTAWEAGRLPASPPTPYASDVLTRDMLSVPDGADVRWDVNRQLAVSEVYGTLRFATPLVELPIDRITAAEQSDYGRFRAQYLGLWRGYFDPVGMRFALNDERVRVETYILPLVQSSEYNELRRRAGGGTTPLEVNGFSPRTVAQFVAHVGPEAPERKLALELPGMIGAGGVKKGLDWIGDWLTVRVDDSPVYARLARLAEQPNTRWAEQADLIFQMPITVGLGIKNSLVFAGVLTGLRGALFNAAPDAVTWEPLEPKYKNVSIVRIQAKPDGAIARELLPRDGKPRPMPAIYYAQVDGGFYASLREDCIKDIIDRADDRKAGKVPKPETVPVNTALYLSPEAAQKTLAVVKFYLEKQVREQALANAPLWYALYRTGVVAPNTPAEAARATALNLFGYVPVSGDGSNYAYDPKADEVTSQRHGSLRRPQSHAAPAETSPLNVVLGQLRTVRADLRFREDGIQTVLTIQRKKP